MIIDLEHHIYAEEQLRKTGGKAGGAVRTWDADGKLRIHRFHGSSDINRHLRFLDEAGIDMAVLTSNSKGDLEQLRRLNDFCAKAVKENPGRFVGFARTLPLGGEPAFEELERAVKELGMKGVHIQARIEGRTLDSRELWPFYEKVSELGIPIDVHIAEEPPGFDALHAPYALYYVMAREFDICAATFRICLGGVLEDFPNLVFIMNHFGGGISAVKDRLDTYISYAGPDFPFYVDKPLISKPWTEYFNKLYFSMAGREVGVASVKASLTNISPKKLMFGTDWPPNFYDNPQGVKRYIEEIR